MNPIFRSLGLWVRGVNDPTNKDLENQEEMYDYCSSSYSCTNDLLRVCSVYKRNDMKNNDVRRFCGCHLPQEEYVIERECDSICTKLGTIPYSRNDIDALKCTRDLCVIDNVSINLKNSRTSGISFNQVCRNCVAGNCLCILGDVSINSVQGFNLNQNCSETLCITDSNSCDEILSSSSFSTIDILIIILSTIGFILSIMFLFNERQNLDTTKITTKKYNNVNWGKN